MKLATSINSYEEIQLDFKIYGKMLAESEHIVPPSFNRLSKLGKASSSSIREQLALAIKEGIKAERNENNYEFSYNTIHKGVMPAIRVYKFPISELKTNSEEYRYDIKDLSFESIYKYNLDSLNRGVEEYRYVIDNLKDNIEEYRYAIDSLNRGVEEYRYSTSILGEVHNKEVSEQVYKYDIVTLRGTPNEEVYRFNVADFKNSVKEYRYLLASLQDIPSSEPTFKEFRYKLSDLVPLVQECRYVLDSFESNEESSIVQLDNKNSGTQEKTISPVLSNINEVEQVCKLSSTSVTKTSELNNYLDNSDSDDIDSLISGLSGDSSVQEIGVQNTQEVSTISKDVSLNSERESNIDVKSEEEIKQSKKLENIPTDIVQFVKLNPRCDISVALKYFKMADINKALNIGRISKSKNKLYL